VQCAFLAPAQAMAVLYLADGTSSIVHCVLDRAPSEVTARRPRAERAHLLLAQLAQLAQPAARLVGASCPSLLLLLLSACPLHADFSGGAPVPVQFRADGEVLTRGDAEDGLDRLGGALQGLRALVVPLSRSIQAEVGTSGTRQGQGTRSEAVRVLAAHLTALAAAPCEAAVALEEAGEGRGDTPFRLRQTRLVWGHWRPSGEGGGPALPLPAPGFVAVPSGPVMEGRGEWGGASASALTPTLWEALGVGTQEWIRAEEARREEARSALKDALAPLLAAREGLSAAVAAVASRPSSPDAAEVLRSALLAHGTALVPVRRAAAKAARATAALAPVEGLPEAYGIACAESGRRRAWEGGWWARSKGGPTASRVAEAEEEEVRGAWGQHLPSLRGSLSLLPHHVLTSLGLGATPLPRLRALAAALTPAPCCEGASLSPSSSGGRGPRRAAGRRECDCALVDNVQGVLWAAVDAVRGAGGQSCAPPPSPEGEVALPPRVYQALSALLQAVDDLRPPPPRP
jgi:hypothetical protein